VSLAPGGTIELIRGIAPGIAGKKVGESHAVTNDVSRLPTRMSHVPAVQASTIQVDVCRENDC
jgi:hypothetical protein